MEKFRILKRTYGSGAIVFIPQYLYADHKGVGLEKIPGWYKNVCNEMNQCVNSFETEKEAIDKIEEYKVFVKDSKIILDEIINIQNQDFKSRLKKRINAPNQIKKICSFVDDLNLSKEKQDELSNIIEDTIIDSYMANFVDKEQDDSIINDLIFIHDSVKDLNKSQIENIIFVSLRLMKDDNKLNIQKAIENAMYGFGYIKTDK